MFLNPKKTGLWVIDVQEKLFPYIDRSHEILSRICYAIETAHALKLPVFITEQAPDKLGETISEVKDHLLEGQITYPKTTFSGYHDPIIREAIDKLGMMTWILVGIEAHICVLQTAKDLIAAKKEVVILNDAVSSRSLFDFSTAMGELRECGARISSTETVLYECVRDSHSDLFKELLPLIKKNA